MRAPATFVRPLAVALLVSLGAYQIALGAYFIVFRPTLLPEDARFMGTPRPPNLEPWLELVFTVMRGQMAALGVAIIALGLRLLSPRTRPLLETLALALAGLLSAGVMCLTNFALGSDFKWALLAPVILWVLAICLAASSPEGRRGSRT